MIATRRFLIVSAASVLLGLAEQTHALEPQAAVQNVKSAGVNAEAKKLTISGTVTDTVGSPLRGVTVEYWCSEGDSFLGEQASRLQAKITTGSNGSFEFPQLHQVGFLLAHKRGLAPAWKPLNMPFSDRDSQNQLVLSPGAKLEGTLVDEANKPVARAKVFVGMAFSEVAKQDDDGQGYNFISGNPIRNYFVAKTDAAGRFHFENFPTNATVSLGVQAPGKALREVSSRSIGTPSLPYRAGQKDIKLVVEPAGSVEGKLVVEDQSKSLPVARFSVQPTGFNFFRGVNYEPVKGDKKGVFRISDVLAGSYRIRADFGTNAPPDWVAEMVPVTVVSGQATRDIQVTAVRGGILEVVVLGKNDRKPLTQATVMAFKDNSVSTAISDTNGLAKMRLMAGKYQISARYKSAQVYESASGNVEAGNTNRMELEIAPPKKITGVVHQPNGQAATGASVRIIGGYGVDGAGVKTDADGKFELAWNPNQMPNNNTTPCLFVRDAEHNLAVAQDLEEDVGPLDLKLAPGLTLAGQAQCNGKPVPNAAATLVFWTGRNGMHIRGLSCGTNVPGRFEIPALPPGRRYGLIVSAPGYGQKSIDDISDSLELSRTELNSVELKLANLKIAGKVTDAEEKPVSGCYVNLNGDGQPNGNTQTDAEGRFFFDQVCEGSIRLFANSQNSSGSMTAEGGDTNIVLQLGQNYSNSSDSKAHKLKGTVTGIDGKAAAGVLVSVFPSNNGPHWTKTATNGTYSLTWSLQSWQQQSGAQLVVRDPVHNLAAVVELSEETTNLDAKLAPALSVTGQVKKPDGTPLVGAEIEVQFKAGNSYNRLDEKKVVSDGQGRYEIKCLPPEAQYMATVSAKGYGNYQLDIPNNSETNRAELSPCVLKVADRILAGQVVNENEKPLSGVNVYIYGEGQPNTSVTTDKDGRFQYKVCEGQIRLSANSQSGFAQATAEGGETNLVITLSSRSGNSEQPQRRASLNGKALPDLASVNLSTESVSTNGVVLVCLFDAGQRPSRYVVRQLNEKAAALKQQGITLVAVQATLTTDEIFNSWKSASPVAFPIGRVTDKTDKSKWASSAPSLPMLILTDARRLVIADGFAFDELDAQVKKLVK